MLELIPPTGTSVSLLDFGCGTGHLLEHINGQGRTDIRYAGLDASQKFIDICRRKFPRHPFSCTDVLVSPEPIPEVDYIVMNGVFTEKRELSSEAMRTYMEELLIRVFAAARIGLAFNVMSKHVDWEREDLFHLSFDSLAEFLKRNLSRHYQFRADYGLYEFTTYIYRSPRN
jgi:SAM-dependent methyltransferase